MTVLITMLRGINLAAHNRVKMDALRALYEGLGLREPQTHVQSGNVVFKTQVKDFQALALRIEKEIEKKFGFRTSVIVRTPTELRDVIARNPFAGRKDIQPNRLLVTFLAADPGRGIAEQIRRIKADPEELRIDGRELYTYYPNGMARPRLTWPMLEKILKMSGTGRNWNSVTKILQMAERLEASS